MDFKLVSDYQPRGDQVTAIAELVRGVRDRQQQQLLLWGSVSAGNRRSLSLGWLIQAIFRLDFLGATFCLFRLSRAIHSPQRGC